MSYLQLNGLNKQFNGTNVLNNVHLEVAKGEMITLLGPSGCGKSTLLRCISGLTELEQGSIILEDQEITALAPREREVGMVFQSYALFPNLTVSDNIGYGLKMKRMNKGDRTRKINELLELVDLSDKAQAYPHTLSGGQQQRVALARSLAMQPKLMLLDEPLSALDAKIRKSLRLQIRQLQRRMGMTMIFVTHDQEEALMISDRICVMHNGRIVQEGSPEEIYSAPRTEFVARFIGNYNVLGPQEAGRLEGLAAQPGISYALRPESITLLPVGEYAMTRPPSFSMPGYPSSSMSEYPSSGMPERESSEMLGHDSFGIGHDLAGMPERDSSSELGHDSAGMLRRESGSRPGRESVVRGYDLLGMSRHLPPAGDSAALYWPGKVSSVMMLGNIVRYGIDVGGIPMTVDTLAGHGPFRPGEQSAVTLRIDRSQCIPLEKDGA